MSLSAWTILNIINALFWLWILRWGGARWLEGFKSALLIHWLTINWNAEQIRLYALLILVISIIWFVVGIFIPELRFFTMRDAA
ncbi:MAG: hypothetical protein HKM93_04700 [Desulfobacteraceae bacterium]|nr:hypothetical protein [Desulfobacteraceae bacterium]